MGLCSKGGHWALRGHLPSGVIMTRTCSGPLHDLAILVLQPTGLCVCVCVTAAQPAACHLPAWEPFGLIRQISTPVLQAKGSLRAGRFGGNLWVSTRVLCLPTRKGASGVTPILQMRKQRLKEVREFGHSCTACPGSSARPIGCQALRPGTQIWARRRPQGTDLVTDGPTGETLSSARVQDPQ